MVLIYCIQSTLTKYIDITSVNLFIECGNIFKIKAINMYVKTFA